MPATVRNHNLFLVSFQLIIDDQLVALVIHDMKMDTRILAFTFIEQSLLPLTRIQDKYWKIGKSLSPSIALLLNRFSNICRHF